MGLFDLLVNVTLGAIDIYTDGKVSQGIETLKEKMDDSPTGRQKERIIRYMEEFKYKTDEELKSIYKHGSYERKAIAANELKNRGYGEKDGIQHELCE